MNYFINSPVGKLIAQADNVSKSVLVALCMLSIICVSIIIYKFFYLRKQNKQLNLFIKRLRQISAFNQLFPLAQEFEHTIAGRYVMQNFIDLKKITEQSERKLLSGTTTIHLTALDLDYTELLLTQSLEQMLIDEESYLQILASSAAVAPLIGLFGTVWGLIHALINISQHKAADIIFVAPGIAEALMTTLVGLIVAIPALTFSHYFSSCIRRIEQQLILVGDVFFALAKRTL